MLFICIKDPVKNIIIIKIIYFKKYISDAKYITRQMIHKTLMYRRKLAKFGSIFNYSMQILIQELDVRQSADLSTVVRELHPVFIHPKSLLVGFMKLGVMVYDHVSGKSLP